MKIAVLDDYQNIALELADWSTLAGRAEITVFNDHIADPAAIIDRLLPFDVVSVMRERTPLPRDIIERLPRLKLIASTGPRERLDRHGSGGRARSEHQQCSAVSFDAFQHREKGRSELQITHKGMTSNGRRIEVKYLLPYTKKSIPRTACM